MKTVSLDELERCLLSRKRELDIIGIDLLPVNDGTRRTASKQRLLRAITENFTSQGRTPRFRTNRD